MTSTHDYDIGALAASSVAPGGERGQSDAPGGSESNGHKRERVFSTSPLGERSLGELVATLSRDVALLVHQEIELIKADLVATALKLAVGATGFVIALVGLLFAVPVLSIAAALGIHALGISLGSLRRDRDLQGRRRYLVGTPDGARARPLRGGRSTEACR